MKGASAAAATKSWPDSLQAVRAGAHTRRKSTVPESRNGRRRGLETAPLQVLSASLPGLPEPGVVSRSRPRLTVSLGSVQKDTEPADFSPSSPSSAKAVPEREHSWRFDEMLTFTVKDLAGPGLKLRLRVLNETQLGPFQFLGRPADVGEAHPSFVPAATAGGLYGVGLGCHRGQSAELDFELGSQKASLPGSEDYLLDLVRPQMNLEQKLRELRQSSDFGILMMEEWAKTLVVCVCVHFAFYFAALFAALCSSLQLLQPAIRFKCGVSEEVDPLDVDAVVGRAATVADVQKPLPAPDLSPENWVSTVGPNGRRYWHNLALGPAPWEESEASPSSPGLPSPEEVPSGWIYREGADGRRFWHHADLGPPPWELPAQASEGPAEGGRAWGLKSRHESPAFLTAGQSIEVTV
ncbi:CPX1 [Symbiodinium natans]|uniref:CPX1 protein n=1 Tax=Symbiodinium natans TaxID=878477 RepID=A0A812HRK6_9DINO|nr:CPX1 [Symbiodinium natans]